MNARTPRPRGYKPTDFLPQDPLDDAVFTDSQGIAGDLADVLEAIKGYDASSIKGVLFRKPVSGLGPFEWLEEVAPPIDMSTIMASLKHRHGGGSYRMQLFAGGKTRKVIEFKIAGDPVSKTPGQDGMKTSDLMALILNMQETSRRDAAEQQRFMMDQQARRDDAMWKALAVIVPVAIPALMGNREKTSDIIALMNANKPETTSLKENLESFALMQKLFNDRGGADFDPSDIVGSIVRAAPQLLGGVGRAIKGGAAPAAEALPPPGYDAGAPLHLAPPTPPPADAAFSPSGPAGADTPRLLRVIAPHVGYFYAAGHDPALAADAVVAIMDREGVTEAELNELVAGFAATGGDWKDALAAHGIDLRSRPQWADAFLAELISAWTDSDGSGDAAAGRGGGLENATDDAETLAPGRGANADPGPGA